MLGVWSRLGGGMGVVLLGGMGAVSDGMEEEEELSFCRGKEGELGALSCSQGSLSWTTKKAVKEEIAGVFNRGSE